jgi:hypothetical protein
MRVFSGCIFAVQQAKDQQAIHEPDNFKTTYWLLKKVLKNLAIADLNCILYTEQNNGLNFYLIFKNVRLMCGTAHVDLFFMICRSHPDNPNSAVKIMVTNGFGSAKVLVGFFVSTIFCTKTFFIFIHFVDAQERRRPTAQPWTLRA